MTQYKKLADAAAGLQFAKTPLEQAKALWQLYVFLNEVDPLELFVSVGDALTELEPELTESDRNAMRALGCTFPEDWDTPREWFTSSEEGQTWTDDTE